MGYWGLFPRENSSGMKIVKGEMTKQGNKESRRLLIESVWHYFPPHQWGKMTDDQTENDNLYYIVQRKSG
jgi:transposase